MSQDKSELRFDSSAEQVGGSYDQGTAETRALVHAQKKFGRRWFRKLPLIWATESSHYNEDVDRWEIVVFCHLFHDEKNRGEWVYHISPDGRKVLPGTSLVRTRLDLKGVEGMGRKAWLFGSLAVVAVLTVGIFLLMDVAATPGIIRSTITPTPVPVQTPSPAPPPLSPTPTLAPITKPTITSTPAPAPAPKPAQAPILIPAPTLANTKIAFESSRDSNQEIYVMDADGSNLMSLTNHPERDDSFQVDDGNPAWSPLLSAEK